MRERDFEVMVRRLAAEVPREYFDGVVEVTVSPRAVPHPVRAEIFTLGECIPLDVGEGGDVQSRIVLYWGSFAALARLDERFDWREEAWETLTHELRHHLEWRARAADLERLDEAAEANFARQDGEPFPAGYHRDGDPVAEGVWRIEDDFFVERIVDRAVSERIEFVWHGRTYAVRPPHGASLPAYLTIDGVDDPPPGELVLVLRRRGGLGALLRRRNAPWSGSARAEPAGGAGG